VLIVAGTLEERVLWEERWCERVYVQYSIADLILRVEATAFQGIWHHLIAGLCTFSYFELQHGQQRFQAEMRPGLSVSVAGQTGSSCSAAALMAALAAVLKEAEQDQEDPVASPTGGWPKVWHLAKA
jgi:hypothetical protein